MKGTIPGISRRCCARWGARVNSDVTLCATFALTALILLRTRYTILMLLQNNVTAGNNPALNKKQPWVEPAGAAQMFGVVRGHVSPGVTCLQGCEEKRKPGQSVREREQSDAYSAKYHVLASTHYLEYRPTRFLNKYNNIM